MEEYLISADKACQIAKSLCEIREKRMWNTIVDTITSAYNNGEFQCVYDGPLPEFAKGRLEHLGYQVYYNGGIIITWG